MYKKKGYRTEKRLNNLDKVLKNVIKTESGCWEWQGAFIDSGYGVTQYHNKRYLVHRLLYTLMKEPISDGLLACHTCDNRKCCNPEHIFLGTHKDNSLDAINKNRLYGRGRKITDEQVLEVINYSNQGYKQKEIAAIYNVDQSLISKIIKKKS